MKLSSYNLIGVHGLLNSGKDTVANYIIHMMKPISFQSQFKPYAFAKPIKEACKVLFGFSDLQLNDRVLKEAVDEFWGFSPRKAMQLMGTEFGRDMLRKDIWIKRAEMEAANNLQVGFSTIITDVRFQNEADWVRSQPSSALIYIKAPGLVLDEKYNHGSEAGITEEASDLVIINDKSLGLDNLYFKINKIFS